MRTPTLVFLSAVVVVAAFIGCGGTGSTSSSQCDPGCTGSGGSTSATSGSTSATGTGGAGGVATTSSTSSTSSTASASGSTGTGSGIVCGGKAGKPCLQGEYCDFSADACSFADESGTCTQRPTACPDLYVPTCGCDGMVYGNACDAAAAGADINLNGTCPPPDGQFACGSGFCQIGTSYCERDTSDVGGVPSTYACKPLPPKCGSSATCACLASVPCGSVCAPSTDGAGLIVTCLGG